MSVTQMPLIKQDRHAPTSKPNAGSEPINKEPYQLRTSSSAIYTIRLHPSTWHPNAIQWIEFSHGI